MSEINLGVNEPGVAEPVDTGVNEPGVAEPDVVTGDGGNVEQPHKNTPHEAWAEMRKARDEADRRAANAERELAEFKAAAEARSAALQRLGGENADINALAESIGVDPSDVLATLNAEQESAKKDLEIQRLQEEVNMVNAEKQHQSDLLAVQAIDPNVKSLYELGDSFIEYTKAGLSAEDAYYAVKAKEINTRVVPPKEIGKINNEPVEKDFFTEAEVDAMSEEQQKANAEKIMASMPRWK